MTFRGPDGGPLVSVIIPTLDRPAIARRAIASALGQQGVTVEVVVVDDGGREPLLDQLHVVDSRVRVLRNDRTQGVAAARNRGIAESHGQWIAFLDDDDVWAPHKLRRQLDVADTCDSSWCIAAAVVVDTKSVAQSVSLCRPDAPSVLAGLCTHNAVPGGGSGVLVKRSIIDQVGGFDESLSMVADWEMWHRLAHTSACAIVPEPLIGYLKHEFSMTATFLEHESEIKRMERATTAYCTSSLKERRLIYLEWIADQTAAYNRIRAAKLKFAVAIDRRSVRTFVMSIRYLLVPSHVELRNLFFRTTPATSAPETPSWVYSQHTDIPINLCCL